MGNSVAAEPPVSGPSLYLTPIGVALAILISAVLLLVVLHFLLKELRDRAGSITLPAARTTCDGVDKAVLDSIPVQAYGSSKPEQECSVCLSALEEGEMVRVLPSCRHVFHVECIDAWFALHSSCPFCRSEVTAAAAAAAAAEGFVTVDVEVDGGSERGGGAECRRSNSLVCFDSFRLMSFREKLRLKRCMSLESCNVSVLV